MIKLGVVVHACNSSYRQEDHEIKASLDKVKQDCISKTNKKLELWLKW
jgi:hypothetical protein